MAIEHFITKCAFDISLKSHFFFYYLVFFFCYYLAYFFYYLAYFFCYLWVSLQFLVLFMGFTVLFQLPFSFIYNIFKKKNSILAK